MACTKFNYFSFLFLAIIATSSNSVLAEKFCKTAIDKDLCKTMVGGATNWNAAIEEAIKTTLSMAENLRSKSDSMAPALVKLDKEKRNSLEKTCKESFETVIDMLKEGQAALKKGDTDTLHTKLSAALDTECVDELSNIGASSPVADMARELNKKVSVCLAIVATHRIIRI